MSLADDLGRLSDLVREGLLTDEEFATAKQRLLADVPIASAGVPEEQWPSGYGFDEIVELLVAGQRKGLAVVGEYPGDQQARWLIQASPFMPEKNGCWAIATLGGLNKANEQLSSEATTLERAIVELVREVERFVTSRGLSLGEARNTLLDDDDQEVVPPQRPQLSQATVPPPAVARPQQDDYTWIPVEQFKWRGIRKKDTILVRCGSCRNQWVLAGAVLEAYRSARSPAGRLTESGTHMATLGMNQGPKKAASLAARNVACPNCGSIAPQVAKV